MDTQAVTSLHEVRFTVTSDGASGKAWLKRLEKKGFCLSTNAIELIYSRNFRRAKGVNREYEVVIIKGSFWNTDAERTTANIRAEAEKRKLWKPNAELAFLIREKFTDKELQAMGLEWVMVMHEPITPNNLYSPYLFNVSRANDGYWLDGNWVASYLCWACTGGFAFVSST